MSRETCYRCFWPKPLCWCERIVPMSTATRYVLLMHPREHRRVKAGTGRLTHLCLSNSEIVVTACPDDHPRVRELVADAAHQVVLLYPGTDAVNLSDPVALRDSAPVLPPGKPLVVLVLDATWSSARKMLRLSPRLQRLPRIMFTPSAPSRFVIKQQPVEGCLSTLESIHEVLTALAASGRDRYERPTQLLELFAAMQQVQLDCANDPDRDGYRRQPYKTPAERRPLAAGSRKRRANFFRVGEAGKTDAGDTVDTGASD